MRPPVVRRTALPSQLLARKSIDKLIRDSEEPEHALKKTLGPWSLTALGIGAVIGSGIFTVIGTAMAGQKFDAPNIGDTPLLHYLIHHTALAGRPGAGPALALSLVLVAIVCVFTGLCYAELASMIPIAGSAYTYTYATLGELIAWIIGWDLILEYAFSNMSVSVGFAAHIVDLLDWFGLHPPLQVDLARLSAHRPAGPGRQRPLPTRLALRLQHSRLSGRHDSDRDPGARHPRVGPHQQHHGAGQDGRHPGLRLCRRQLHQAALLASLHAQRLDRRAHRRLHHLLHLHRLRLGLDGGRGVQESAARPAHRHPGHAGGLHRALRRGGHRAQRHRALAVGDGRCGPGGQRAQEALAAARRRQACTGCGSLSSSAPCWA